MEKWKRVTWRCFPLHCFIFQTSNCFTHLFFSPHSCSNCNHKCKNNFLVKVFHFADSHPALTVINISSQMGSQLLLYISPVMITLTDIKHYYHHPLRSHLRSNSQVGCVRTQITSSCSAALCDVSRALGAAMWHAGRKQKPEKWRNRLGKITHCCLTLRQGCLCRMLLGKQGGSGA